MTRMKARIISKGMEGKIATEPTQTLIRRILLECELQN